VVYESIEYGVLSIGRGIISGGGWQPQVAGGGGRQGRDGVATDASVGRVADASLPDTTFCHRPTGAATRHLRIKRSN
jgi:hypothetical protein